ncbi:MAG: thioesterase family protein [Acidimicrobiales bacterium]|nr:thioesterase family protein [Acidimicrobiales bacterium]
MTDSLFVREGDLFRATELSLGPWAPGALHGGPVAALMAWELERWPTDTAMFGARFTLELFHPVGLEPLRLETRVVRGGRKVQVLETHMYDMNAKALARATLQQIRIHDLALADEVVRVNGPDPTPTPPLPEALRLVTMPEDVGVSFISTATEHRVEGNYLSDPGPAVDWIRLLVDVVPGETPSPLQRVAAAADFGNGVSAVFPFGSHLFINPDLSIHLYRQPVDEWVCLQAITRVGNEGIGFAESALFDRAGRIGRSVQSLLIDRFE